MRRVGWRHIRCHDRNIRSIPNLTRHIANTQRIETCAPIRTPIAQTRCLSSSNASLEAKLSFFNAGIDDESAHRSRAADAILERARAHGIETWDRLDLEADLGPVRNSGSRLLDDDSIRQDLDLWEIVLDYRQLKDGTSGVRQVLLAMLHMGDPVKLQSDSVSEHIWRTILPVALAEEEILFELCVIRSAILRDKPLVFADVVGQLLAAGNLHLAIVYGTQHLLSHFRGHADLIHLFDIAFQSATKDALLGFCQLVSRLPRYLIYSKTIPRLWEAGRKEHAFLLHRHLVSLDDHPASFDQIEPFVRELAAMRISIEPFLRHMEKHGVSYSHQIRRSYAQEKLNHVRYSNLMQTDKFVRGPGARPVKLSDEFVARTFATRSVSFDFVLNGLIFIGLFEIGPLAVRELALAAENVAELKRRFHQLEKMEVDLGASNYVRVVKNLCMSERQHLLQAILDSDMHHDELEDFQKQKRLLDEYHCNLQWPEVNRTLAVLNRGETHEDADSRSVRLMLQTALTQGAWREVLMTLDSTRIKSQGSAHQSELAPLRLALRLIWAKIEAKFRTDTDYLERYSYLVGFIQLSQAAGLRVHPWQWRSVLHAVGRSADWNLFHRLMLSLSRLLSTEQQVVKTASVGQKAQKQPVLDEFFSSDMQSFVLEVGLTAALEGDDPCASWLRGVSLLRKLSNDFAVNIDYHAVSNAFKGRLQSLFSGVDLGLQRRLVSSYLRRLNWAWAEVMLSSEEKLPHSLYQRGRTKPDLESLKLFQLRSRFVKLRKQSQHRPNTARTDPTDLRIDETDFVARPETNHTSDAGISNAKGTKRGLVDEAEDDDNPPVFYEDLLHPSYVKANGVQW